MKYPPYESCPCGSGKKAKFCHLDAGRIRKQPASITPPGPSTGMRHPDCYAAFLADCSDEISGEHPLSRSVLKDLADGKGTISIDGLPGKHGEFKPVSIESLKWKMLCARHNNALSDLDGAMLTLSRALKEIDGHFLRGVPSQDTYLLAGEDIQRWAVKAVVGMVESPLFADSDTQEHAELLYGKRPWRDWTGLYLHTHMGGVTQHGAFGGIGILSGNDTGKVLAARFRIRTLVFNVLFGRPDHLASFGIYRPGLISFVGPGSHRKRIVISWSDSADHLPVEFTQSGVTDTDPEVLLPGFH